MSLQGGRGVSLYGTSTELCITRRKAQSLKLVRLMFNVYARSVDGTNELAKADLLVNEACDFINENEAYYVSMGYLYLIALPY